MVRQQLQLCRSQSRRDRNDQGSEPRTGPQKYHGERRGYFSSWGDDLANLARRCGNSGEKPSSPPRRRHLGLGTSRLAAPRATDAIEWKNLTEWFCSLQAVQLPENCLSNLRMTKVFFQRIVCWPCHQRIQKSPPTRAASDARTQREGSRLV